MRKLNGRDLKALFILSIVAPVGILASLRLTGILQEPKTISETVTLESINWEFQRPNNDVYIDKKLDATYVNSEFKATMLIWIGAYHENDPIIFDHLSLGIIINSSTTNPDGFIENIYVVLRENYQASKVSWVRTDFLLENLSIVDLKELPEENSVKAYARFVGLNHSNRANLQAAILWKLWSSNAQSHQMEISCELIYYNGTAHKKMAQPFQLRILGRS